MRIAKSEVLNFLHRSGQLDLTGRARSLLPDPVDTDECGGLLAQLGLCVLDLLAEFSPAPLELGRTVRPRLRRSA